MLRCWVDGRDTEDAAPYLDKIESFEAARRAAFPWLPAARRE
jgi:hypothetical protein